jgi:hypothetical protein
VNSILSILKNFGLSRTSATRSEKVSSSGNPPVAPEIDIDIDSIIDVDDLIDIVDLIGAAHDPRTPKIQKYCWGFNLS